MREYSAETELLLTRYLDGELGEESRVEFEERMARDSNLREELETRKRLRLQLRGAVQGLSVPDLQKQWVLHDTLRRRTLLRSPAAWRNLQVAGALGLLVLLAVVSWQVLRAPYTLMSDLPQSVAAVLQIGIGKHVSCVKDRQGASMFALGTFSTDMPEENRRLLEAAERVMPADFRVVERHICGTPERRFAHLVMAKDALYISVLVTDRLAEDPELPVSSYAAASVDGLQIYAVRHDGLDVGAFALPTQYAFVVSDAGAMENLEFSRMVASALRVVP
ncbi:MAG: hypothetical protein KIT83_17625 [Bryobacterales bacterium]|nr:hypothetical protein [Bryobacterales bacterium]